MATTTAKPVNQTTNTANNFMAQFDTFKKWSNLVALPLGLILLAVTCYHFSWTLCLLTVVILSAGLLPNFLWFVPTGYIGVMTIFGTQLKKSYTAGLPCLRLPFVSDTNLIEVREQKIALEDKMKKTITRNKLELFKGLFTYTLKAEEAHWIASRYGIGKKFQDEFLVDWVDSAIDTVVGKLTYAHFQGKKPEVEEWMTKVLNYMLAIEMSKNTASVTSGSFNTIAYTLEPVVNWVANPDKDPSNPADAAKPDFVEKFEFEDILINAEKGETERVVKLQLVETPVTLPGVNPFDKVSVRINTIVFEKDYENAKAGVKAAEAALEKARLDAEAMREKAKGTADAKRELGKGDADAAQMLMASLGNDADAVARILAAREMKNLQGTLVQGGGAGVMVSPNTK